MTTHWRDTGRVPPPARAVSAVCGPAAVDLPPPDPVALGEVGAATCLRRQVLPLGRMGALRPVLAAPAADRPDTCRLLEAALGPVTLVPAPGAEVEAQILALSRIEMIEGAERRVPDRLSCRSMRPVRAVLPLSAAVLALACLAVLAPGTLVGGAIWLALALAALNAGMGAVALALSFTRPPAPCSDRIDLLRMPVITLLVPLHRETEVIDRLLARLSRLDYPHDCLDVLLICEEDDHGTRSALAARALPDHMRVVAVPRGPVLTKPRAMNYALNQARGQIIGIYDAEDAPPPDQLQKVARRFATLGPEVACLQGALAYYNVTDSWITRAFALDYAIWFRLILPALARLGAVVPLGGTTVFLRRDALEAIGGWDAHNVTEDADLGVRLRRLGYRCELLDSTTEEEATCRAWPWIRQRSRWLKGYALTWIVHMRDPARLWRDLGPAGFFWFQLLFLGTLGGFALAPALWLCWLRLLPATQALIPAAAPGVLTLALPLAGAALVQAALAARAATRAGLVRHLPWLPMLWPYFAMGTLAVYRAFAEVLIRPFWWDKTSHGVSAAHPAAEECATR